MSVLIDRTAKEKERSNRCKRDVTRKISTHSCRASPHCRSSTFRSSTSRGTWTLVILVILTMSLPQVLPKQYEEFLCNFIRYQEDCEKTLNETWTDDMKHGNYCRGEFDGFICWPHGQPESIVKESCPSFLPWTNTINESSTGFRFCMKNSSWFKRPSVNGELEVWNHRAACDPFQVQPNAGPIDLVNDQKQLIDTLEVAYTIGYAISLCCLVVALILLTFFKKLHCTRNYIHMNLMISFIVRYVAILVKDRVIEYHYDPGQFPTLNHAELKLYCDDFGGASSLMVSCRMVVILMHYAIVANYFWLLAEGLYLQLILVFAMKSDRKYFPAFMAFGWGGPWIPVGVWVALRLAFDNVGCWEMFDTHNVWWALRGPVILSIAINFLIFINIIRIIVSKLRANNISRTDNKYRLAKSTLALIPLLGIHYIIFLIVDEQISNSVMNVKICFEMMFTSIQGALISVLYCFMNGEVQTEVKKLWNHWRVSNGLPPVTSRKHSAYNSNGATQMTSVMSGHISDYTTMASHDATLLTPIDGRDTNNLSVPANGDIRLSYNGSAAPLLENGESRAISNRSEESL